MRPVLWAAWLLGWAVVAGGSVESEQWVWASLGVAIVITSVLYLLRTKEVL